MANRYPLIVDSSSQQIKEFPSGDTLVIDNLQVTGTTTTLETATLNVEDKNITINYSSGDSSSTADGSGLTFQDAVDASTDATILWDTTNDRFQFSHGIEVTSGNVGIGTVPHSNSKLHVLDSSSSLDDYTIHIESYQPAVVWQDISGGPSTDFALQADGSALMFRYGDATTETQLASEAMRIKSTGALSVNKSAYITQVALTSSSNAVAWDAQAAANAYHLLTENTTFAAPSNAVEGAIISVEIAQGGTPYTVAWNTIYEFAASTAPTMTATANKTDILSFRYNGSVWQEIGRVQNLAQT